MKYDFELSNHYNDCLSILIKRIKPNSVILEFGPANGRMTRYLKEKLSCTVYCVELDEKAAEDVLKYAKDVIVEDIEIYSWKEKYKDIKFDYIVFADVLEHLYYPEKVLQNCKQLLKKEGSILISLPNISHNSVLIDLINDKFIYRPTGLLDDTHIRFFTKTTFDKIIDNNGLFKSYESYVYLNPNQTEFENTYELLPLEISNYLRELSHGNTYQLIYELKKQQVEKIEKDFQKEYIKKHIQLYIDSGEGFNEKESIIIDFKNQNEVLFDLIAYKNVKRVRFDPLNIPVLLRLKSIFVNKKKFNDNIISNATWIDGDIYYFNKDDPNIYIEFKSDIDIKTIFFEIEYFESQNLIKKLTNSLNNSINKTINELQIKEEKLNQQLKEIYSSNSWKITKPLRKISKILKDLRNKQ